MKNGILLMKCGDRSFPYSSKQAAERALRKYIRWVEWGDLNLLQIFIYKIFIYKE